MEFSLLGAAAIGVACFWAMLKWEAPRGNAAGCAVDLWEAGITSAIAGVFIGRVAAMVTTGINPITDPGQILLVRSGVSTTAAAVGAIAVFAALARRDLVTTADAIAPAALAGFAGWHAGCVTSNACLGVESGVPWAWSLPGSTVTRHPVELYVAIGMALVAGVLATWKRRGRPSPGVVAGSAVATAGALRLATEPLRISIDGGPVATYLIAAIVGVGWMTVAVLADRRITRTG
ncbi:MAG TPA: prolipoprotein diacylglyceryl transferase family protein [Acidimicrobiia bacterium]|nr:prolipoprotein diacylglyceryl transferase family protein [Acidimicrobiia bacterium]